MVYTAWSIVSPEMTLLGIILAAVLEISFAWKVGEGKNALKVS